MCRAYVYIKYVQIYTWIVLYVKYDIAFNDFLSKGLGLSEATSPVNVCDWSGTASNLAIS